MFQLPRANSNLSAEVPGTLFNGDGSVLCLQAELLSRMERRFRDAHRLCMNGYAAAVRCSRPTVPSQTPGDPFFGGRPTRAERTAGTVDIDDERRVVRGGLLPFPGFAIDLRPDDTGISSSAL